MTLLRGRTSAPVARDGDLIIVQEKYNSLMPLKLKAGAVLDNRYGRFLHDDLIGQPLGRRWEAKSHPAAGTGTQQCAGFVHALSPTPELWTLSMSHRTQIVYSHDVAIIALFLELRPGCVVVEAGTGSGSASAAFARTVAPTGVVHSFEFHAPRAAAAEIDFEALGVSTVVRVSGGIDVIKEGFVGVAKADADAVFLDLPAPYLMGDEVARVLKPNGTVCTFSPCIEQVQRSAEMFRRGPFHSVRTITAPVRTYETREQVLGTPGFDKLQVDVNSTGSSADSAEQDGPQCKRQRTNGNGATKARRKSLTAGAERLAMAGLNVGRHDGRVIRAAAKLHSRPFSSMKGHTSYLTFARRRRGNVKDEKTREAPILPGDQEKGNDNAAGDRTCAVS